MLCSSYIPLVNALRIMHLLLILLFSTHANKAVDDHLLFDMVLKSHGVRVHSAVHLQKTQDRGATSKLPNIDPQHTGLTLLTRRAIRAKEILISFPPDGYFSGRHVHVLSHMPRRNSILPLRWNSDSFPSQQLECVSGGLDPLRQASG